MEIAITFRHMDGTEAIRSHVQEKLVKLEKYFEKNTTIEVILWVEKLDNIAEVRVSSGKQHFHAKEIGKDSMYATIDALLDNLKHQISEAKQIAISKRDSNNS